jgi:hypothetical protein
LAYGNSTQSFRAANPVVPQAAADFSGYTVYRFRDNAPVTFQRSPLPLDNSNQQLIVAWSDAQNAIYTDRLGTYGLHHHQTCGTCAPGRDALLAAASSLVLSHPPPVPLSTPSPPPPMVY